MGALYLFVSYTNYRDQERQLKRRLFNEMKIFSYRPLGKEFEVAFASRDKAEETGRLMEGSGGVYAYFDIPGSKKYLLKISLSQKEYDRKLSGILEETLRYAPLYLILILILSIIFALYALYPLKKALMLNEEFVKDLLHDINTPMSSIRVNLQLLKRKCEGERSIERVSRSVEVIEGLQSNLQSFLRRQPLGREVFDLVPLLKNRLEYFRQIYPEVDFEIKIDEGIRIETNLEAFQRIVDNLLSNAGKYNRKGGKVSLSMHDNSLLIEDTGRGIEHPKKAFLRYYREGERGLGLGLHIVKKLSEELEIDVRIESSLGQGTQVWLELSGIIYK